jgi:hypothetical protein
MPICKTFFVKDRDGQKTCDKPTAKKNTRIKNPEAKARRKNGMS